LKKISTNKMYFFQTAKIGLSVANNVNDVLPFSSQFEFHGAKMAVIYRVIERLMMLKEHLSLLEFKRLMLESMFVRLLMAFP